ncbi:MAG: LD-carboxypeptidase [Candidatus Glassbacteria bacterium]|nr:LD-carboxypeptidase [Candidatus Glassbacteria bacterium]
MNTSQNYPIRPPLLRKGDTVGLVAPASPLIDLRDISRAKKVLAGLGFRVVEGRYIRRRHGFLAGADSERTADIHRMFENRSVNAVMALRGGYGSARILDSLDWELIRSNPKVLVGHSDLTALLNAVHQRTGLVTFWGPQAGYDLGRCPSPFKTRHLLSVIGRAQAPLPLPSSPPSPRRKLKVLSGGRAEGRLTGGNLSIITSLLGTPYEIDTSGRIFFFEDVDEEPYKIDRMLNQLAQAGKLREAAGVIVGRCVDCESSGRMKRSFRLADVLEHWLAPLGKPAIYGLPVGHEQDKLTLPIGVKALLEAGDTTGVTLLEPSVTADGGHAG